MPNPDVGSQNRNENVRKKPNREELIGRILSVLPEPPKANNRNNSETSKRKMVKRKRGS